MKKIISLLCIMLLSFGFWGCGSSSSTSTSEVKKAPVEQKKEKIKLTAQSISDKLKEKENTYMTEISVITADNDPNKFLGRPNQYIEKITWKDNRLKDSQVDCSIELFSNKEDAAARKTYLEGVIKTMPTFMQYIEQKDNILLRIDGGLTPTQSDEYIKIFKAL